MSVTCSCTNISTVLNVSIGQCTKYDVSEDFPLYSTSLQSSKYENSTAMFCCTSFLTSTHARPSIAIKDRIVFDQYFGLGPSSGSILMILMMAQGRSIDQILSYLSLQSVQKKLTLGSPSVIENAIYDA